MRNGNLNPSNRSRKGNLGIRLAAPIAAAILAIASAQARPSSLEFLDLGDAPEPRAPAGFTPLIPTPNSPTPDSVTGFARPSTNSRAGILQCVPYARQLSGIQIHGDAWTWWDQAAGRYDRGNQPRVGAVLALQASGVMPLGHVATVSRLISSREIRLSHANWSGPGVIERDVMAVDVSPENDWSQVRIWFGRTGTLGLRINPANGFIYPQAPALERPLVRYASADLDSPRSDGKRGKKNKSRKEKPEKQVPHLDYDLFVIEYVDAAPSDRYAAR